MRQSTIDKMNDGRAYNRIVRLLPSMVGKALVVYNEETRESEVPFIPLTEAQATGVYTPVEDYLNRLLNERGLVIHRVCKVEGGLLIRVKPLARD